MVDKVNMTAVLSPQATSQSPSPTALPPRSSPSPNHVHSSLPPLVTSPPLKAQGVQRASSNAKKRLSAFSSRSATSQTQAHSRSRPHSNVFPYFSSSLPYALVRDFAYPAYHPMHFGPAPEQASGISTPASEAHRRLSDPSVTWDRSDTWDSMEWRGPGEQLQPTIFGDDGPPWSEDDDLQSPVVTSARHRKNKSNMFAFDHTRGRTPERDQPRRGSYRGTNGDGSETYYVSDLNEAANGPGGEYITYPASAGARLGIPRDLEETRRDSHFAASLPNRSHQVDGDEEMSSSPVSTGIEEEEYDEQDDSRYSRDYQFTIASPDEEMHGRAVALFDFARENDNELPLVEGQVILVSYRHGQGWLVAQDPKTGESGLVPEEYVRLLKDIEGGWHGLMNGGTETTVLDGAAAELQPEARTPTQQDHDALSSQMNQRVLSGQNQIQGADYYPPVVSTFSTTREDLEPWPHREYLLNSQTPTPTSAEGFPRRPSLDQGAQHDDDDDDDDEDEEMMESDRLDHNDEHAGQPTADGVALSAASSEPEASNSHVEQASEDVSTK